jgi:hypothetical protein
LQNQGSAPPNDVGANPAPLNLSDNVVNESTGDEAEQNQGSAPPFVGLDNGVSPYLDVEDGVNGVNEIVPPYVEVDSTGILVKGDETEIINL